MSDSADSPVSSPGTAVDVKETAAADKQRLVWEGVYGSFAEAPVTGPGFDGSVWRERSLATAQQSLDAHRRGEPLDYSLGQRNAVLPAIASALIDDRKRLRILDFGGGLGFGYIHLLSTIPNAAAKIDYNILELPEICRDGRTLFAGASAPTFVAKWPEAGEIDIVFTASAIQYVEDWLGVIATMARYRPRFLIFSDLFIGNVPSYVTLQNYYGSKIAHWILNEKEFLGAVESHGYELRYRGNCEVAILGRIGPPPMGNLPSDRRLRSSSNVVFAHIERDVARS